MADLNERFAETQRRARECEATGGHDWQPKTRAIEKCSRCKTLRHALIGSPTRTHTRVR